MKGNTFYWAYLNLTKITQKVTADFGKNKLDKSSFQKMSLSPLEPDSQVTQHVWLPSAFRGLFTSQHFCFCCFFFLFIFRTVFVTAIFEEQYCHYHYVVTPNSIKSAFLLSVEKKKNGLLKLSDFHKCRNVAKTKH